MYTITRDLQKQYPSWYGLTDDEKEIVKCIAIQLPISCEEVARIFTILGGDMKQIREYIYLHYGFVVD